MAQNKKTIIWDSSLRMGTGARSFLNGTKHNILPHGPSYSGYGVDTGRKAAPWARRQMAITFMVVAVVIMSGLVCTKKTHQEEFTPAEVKFVEMLEILIKVKVRRLLIGLVRVSKETQTIHGLLTSKALL